MEHKGTVLLETERLILRRFTMEDADLMFKNWANNPIVTKYLCWPPHSDILVSKEVLNDWISSYQKPNYYQWAIELKDISEPIGSIAIVKQCDDIGMVHVGYCIGRNWWGKSYTSEALAALIKFFFEDVGVSRVESRHDPNNPGSGKVMMKCGMKYEGTMRKADTSNLGIVDSVHYAILAEDYFDKK